MANQEMIRIRLKAYDHQLIDASCEKIVKPQSATALPFPAPSPCRPRKRSAPVFALFISTRIPVSSSSAEPTKD